MAAPRECPMCGEAMRLVTRDTTAHVPGQSRATSQRIVEWVCPECDHFEEAEDEGPGGTGGR